MRVSNRDAGGYISTRQDFDSLTGSLWGRDMRGPVKPYITGGYLPDEHRESLRSADYVVMSYATPIAWHSSEGWTIPDVKYSVTTSKHQGIVRRAV